WHRRNLAWWRRPWFWCKVAAVWVFLVYERIGLARGAGASKDEAPQDNNFTLHGSKAVADIDLSAAALFALCHAENQRRMPGYEPRLLRPQAVPRLIRFLRRFLRDRRPASAALAGETPCRSSPPLPGWRRGRCSSAISGPARCCARCSPSAAPAFLRSARSISH